MKNMSEIQNITNIFSNNQNISNSNNSFQEIEENGENFVPYEDLTQIPSICTFFIVVYFCVSIVSLFGNAAVCFTVISNRKMQTVVNCYIVNLALCDLMVGSFVLPVKLLELTAPARWGALNDSLCTLMLYLQTVFVFASVLTLVATCIERYLAIVHPLESRVQQSRSRTAKILFIVWLLPLIGAGPFLYPSNAVENTLTSDYGTISRLTCFNNFSPSFRKAYFTFLFVFFYAIPLLFIAWTCIRITQCLLSTSTLHREGSLRRQELNRRKVAKMILIVVAAFAISWTPYFLITIITQYSNVNFMHKHNFFFTMLSINLFAFLNSSINPFIYAIMSSRFRTGFVSILRFLFCASSHSSDNNHNHQNIHSNDVRNCNQLVGEPAPPSNHRFRGRSAIARYHRQMVLMVCRGPTQVSTDSLPPTESPHAHNHVTINPMNCQETEFGIVDDNDSDLDNERELNEGWNNLTTPKIAETLTKEAPKFDETEKEDAQIGDDTEIAKLENSAENNRDRVTIAGEIFSDSSVHSNISSVSKQTNKNIGVQ